jgi:hypothetical protein
VASARSLVPPSAARLGLPSALASTTPYDDASAELEDEEKEREARRRAIMQILGGIG